jgi:uncharacterized iron-regulated membrane protein
MQLWSWRKTARRLHLWLGLSVGLLLVLISLSGAAVVFYVELDQALHPQLQQAQAEPDYQQALATVRALYPDRTGPWRFEVTDSAGIIPARYYNPVETQGQGFAPLLLWLSSDGRTVLRQEFWGQHLMTWLYNLHYQLLLGSTGTVVVGYFGLASLLLLLSGLMAWWPKAGQWRKSLSFKSRSSVIGALYDWHKSLGLLSVLPLLLLTLTGVMLALPEPTAAVLQQLPGQKAKAATLSAPEVSAPEVDPGQQHIRLNQALSAARGAAPEGQLAWIETPALQGPYYKFRVQLPGDPSRRFPHSYIQIDAYSGAVAQLLDIREQGSTERVLNWLHPLHDGSVGGLVLRCVWLLFGFFPLLLAWLGIRRYLLRRRGRI